MATSDAITLSPPVEAGGGGPALGPARRPVRREEYLYRVGSHATLMTVETITAPDGTERRRVRLAFWPGL
jgi:hypothetical protein